MKKNLFFLLIIFLFQNVVLGQKSDEVIRKEIEILHTKNFSIRDSLMTKIQLYNDSVQSHRIYLIKDSLYNIYDSIEIEDLKLDIDFSLKHPYSANAFRRVSSQIRRQPAMKIYDDFLNLYNNISETIKNSEEGIKFSEELKKFKQSNVGHLSPNILGKDNNGKDFNLQSLNKDYILIIDFWASWCAPCIQDLSFYKNILENYPKDKIRIISISIDENTEKWKNSIDKLQLNYDNWFHYSIKENQSNAKEDFFVGGIPHTLLVDENGIIVGKFKGSGEKNKNKISEIIKKLIRK